jgi:hypothetical protein
VIDFTFRSMGDLNEWNRRELAKRGPNHTVQDSLAEMRRQRDVIRTTLASMSEQELDSKAWMPLIFGWVTARDLLQAIIVHNVAEYWKLWLRTGKHAPAPSPAAIHFRLNFMMAFMAKTVNKELAARKPFTVVWNFDGAGRRRVDVQCGRRCLQCLGKPAAAAGSRDCDEA